MIFTVQTFPETAKESCNFQLPFEPDGEIQFQQFQGQKGNTDKDKLSKGAKQLTNEGTGKFTIR